MNEIKHRNLYFPILGSNRVGESNSMHKMMQYSHKNDAKDILKLIQSKKAQLERNNFQNQESDMSSDNQQTHQDYKQGMNNKYKIFSLQNGAQHKQNSFVNKQPNYQERLKTSAQQLNQRLNEQHQNEQHRISVLKGRHFRIRTQQNQNSPKKSNNQSRKINNKIVKAEPAKPLIKYLKPNQMTKQLAKIIPTIPSKIKDRNSITLKEAIQFLQQYNPFFMKLDRIVATCLLKVCTIVKKQKREIIFAKQTIYSKFFIILSGKVKLSNKAIQLKKICAPGQTILQEAWVGLNDHKKTLQSQQKARSIGESYLLEIQMDKFKKVKQQLTKFGFKTQYNELQSLIKRNYIVKNALRIDKNKF